MVPELMYLESEVKKNDRHLEAVGENLSVHVEPSASLSVEPSASLSASAVPNQRKEIFKGNGKIDIDFTCILYMCNFCIVYNKVTEVIKSYLLLKF